ncbi:MAG: ribonuclease III domain-containing protein [Thermoleophilia bacterium]
MLTHRSWVHDRADSYERLELLGDAVLQLVVTDELMARHPRASEGDLAWMRQGIVSREACAVVARHSGLPERMREAAPDPDALRQVAGRDSVAGALAEAVIGAAFLDLPRDEVDHAVVLAFEEHLAAAKPGVRDAKTTLQELMQRDGRRLGYELVRTEGPPHRRRFVSRALIDGAEAGVGRGPSKQASQQEAARAALRALEGGEAG